MFIRDAKPEDGKIIAEIYNYYVMNTIITFEEQPVSDSEMTQRIIKIEKHFPWLVAEEERVLGYAYASTFRERASFRYSIETSVYCEINSHNRGIGSILYSKLLERVKDQGFKVAYGCIALPNAVSVKVHENFGFKKVAHLSQVGFKMEKWIDVGYWEKILN
jgi:L-amino acid N-acyltransferase YncA